MRFYIGSRLKNKEQVRLLSRRLKEAGWEHTYDWTASFPQTLNREILRAMGEQELAGIKAADVVIILTPEGNGTHTELGIALGLGKKIFLCHEDGSYFRGDEMTSTFYCLPAVTQVVGDVETIAQEVLRCS